MNKQLESVRAFHKKFRVPIEIPRGKTSLPLHTIPEDKRIRELRKSLFLEEAVEYLNAESSNNMVEIADAIADLLYILYGTCLSYGIPIDEIFDEVHRTNMAKIGGPTREDGKILKPEGWQPPDIDSILRRYE